MNIGRILFINSCASIILLITSNAYSGNVNYDINELHARLHKLETSDKKTSSMLQIHGLVEVEYGYNEDYFGADSSNIILATVELSIETRINDNVDIQISLLHENDASLEIDLGVINFHDDNSPFSASIGQLYVPFGSFESNMISDPLTLELGETRESTMLVNYQLNGMSAGFYIFNGDIEEGASADKITQFGASLGIETHNFAAGVDYISAFSDTDAIQESLGAPATVIEQVAGLSVHATYAIDAFSFIAEYVGALDTFDATQIAFRGVGAEPSAMNMEFAMDMPVAGHDGTIALGYQTTDEAIDLGAPENRVLIAYSTDIYEATSLAVEYLRDTDYRLSDGGSDKTSETVTIQLATEF